MSKLLIVVGALALSASGVFAGSKCDIAKSYLDANRANLIPTFNLETSNQKVKLVQQSGVERLGLLDRAIDRNHQFLCGHAMKALQQDVDFVENNLTK